MSDSSDSLDSPIPVLTDILVVGDPVRGAPEPGAAEAVMSPAVPEMDVAAAAVASPAVSSVQAPDLYLALNADLLAERLQGRCMSYLTGEGREAVEARCRDLLQDQTQWLVNQITREVALSLETKMAEWVREAVHEELAVRLAEMPAGPKTNAEG
ncbi:DUF2486 family protein [Paraburkholderia hayleyella]|uniref:DUF2486 family protein n=1 Tax=Paraburkholderia hayleyella TaxID=2152889 RepID=UPI001FE7DF43|nr:DUF2486 family protein [Paraburkholderia hayleyella]